MNLLVYYCGAANLLLDRYKTKWNIWKAQSEVPSMIKDPTPDTLDFSEDLWAHVRRMGRTHWEEDLKSLFGDDLVMSIKPKVRRY